MVFVHPTWWIGTLTWAICCIPMIICMVIAIVVPFVLTVVFRKYNILNKSDQVVVSDPELGK